MQIVCFFCLCFRREAAGGGNTAAECGDVRTRTGQIHGENHRISRTCCHLVYDCGTPCTPALIVVVGHYAQSAAVGLAWQRALGGTAVTTDAAASSVRT